MSTFDSYIYKIWNCYCQDRVLTVFSIVLFAAIGGVILLGMIVETAMQVGHLDSRYQFFWLGKDNGAAERLGYLILSATIGMLWSFNRRYASNVVSIVILIYLFVFIDDAFRYHERVGGVIAEYLDIKSQLGLRGKDIGELLAWLLAATVLSVMMILAVKRRAAGDLELLIFLMLPFAGIVGCGLIFDMAHQMTSGSRFDLLFGWIEDGGELAFIALAGSFAMLCWRSGGNVFLTPSPERRGR